MNGVHFNFCLPTKIKFGWDLIEETGSEISRFGRKVIIVTGKSAMKRSGLLDKVIKSLSVSTNDFKIYSSVEPEPTVEQIDNAYTFLREYKPDVIIALGGGSTIDFAKALSILFTNQGSIWDYVKIKEKIVKKIVNPSIPLIAIPTTAGTGSEVTPFCVITNKKKLIKKGIRSQFIYPKIALLDPSTLNYLSKKLIAYTGMDAFAQALESLTSKKANVFTNIFSIRALKLISKSLVKLYRNSENVEVKSDMMLGSLLAGISIGQIDVGLAHAMAQSLGSYYKIPHGLAVAILTPSTMSFNVKYQPERFQILTDIFRHYLHINNNKPKACINIVEKMLIEMGIYSDASKINILKKNIPFVAKNALDIGSIKNNIKEVSKNEIEKIYYQALNKISNLKNK